MGGIACFEKEQPVVIDNERYVIRRMVNPSTWQLESEISGLLVTKTQTELLELYMGGQLRFVITEWDNTDRDEIRYKRQVASLDQLPKKLREAAKIRRTYVTQIRLQGITVLTKSTLTPVINEVWAKLRKPKKPPHWITVYRWYRIYSRSGFDIASLVDRHYMKGNKVRRYADKLLAIVEKAVDKIYFTRERKTMVDAKDHAVVLIKRENKFRPPDDQLPLPTDRLIRSAIYKVPAYDRYVARYGKQAALAKFRAVLHQVTAERPLQRVEIDHTRLDLFVIDDDSLLPLGRPWLTMCLDVCTRNVLGIHISFDPPSHLSIARCLREAILPKLDILKDYPDIQNSWDCYGVMEAIIVDNGLEMHGDGLDAFCYSMGADIEYCPRKKAWFKGKVERIQGTLNRDVAHGFPGTTFSNIFEKDDYDPAEHAVITYSAIREMIYTWIVDYYHQKPHRALEMSPAQAWNENQFGTPIPLPFQREDLDAMLGRLVPTRTVTHKGVELHGLFYNSDIVTEMRMELGDPFKTSVRYDDEDIGHLYIIHPQTNQPIRVPAIRQDYAAGLTSWQHRLYKTYAKRYLPDRKGIEALAEAKERISEIVESELYNKKSKSRVKVARYKYGSSNPVSRKEQENEAHVVSPVDESNELIDTAFAADLGNTCWDLEDVTESRDGVENLEWSERPEPEQKLPTVRRTRRTTPIQEI